MAIFTATLGEVIESGFEIDLSGYPIFDETYREGLNAKIIEHYYFREIGMETPELFSRFLRRRMNEIMPYFNDLYRTTLHNFDPLKNYDLTTTGDSTAHGLGTQVLDRDDTTWIDTESDTDSTARALVHNTPQMQLSNQEDYATNVTDNTSEAKATSNSKQTGKGADTTTRNLTDTNEYVTHVSGLSGITAAQAIMIFRDSLINIDVMVIGALGDLFMGLYSNDLHAL